MIRKISWAFILFSVSFAFDYAAAEDAKIPVMPGMYNVTVTSSSDKSSNSTKNVVDMCIDEVLLDPEDYFPKSAGCNLANIKKEDRKATFDIDCAGGEGKEGGIAVPAMKGAGECSTTDSELYCNFIMEGAVQGEEFKVRSRREGKRIGDCPEQ